MQDGGWEEAFVLPQDEEFEEDSQAAGEGHEGTGKRCAKGEGERQEL